MKKEEIDELIKVSEEIGKIIGTYGNEKQIETFIMILKDYKYKNKEYFKLKKDNEELKEIKEKENFQEYALVYITAFLKGCNLWKKRIKNKIKQIESYMFLNEEDKRKQDYAIDRLEEMLEGIDDN